MSSLVNAVDDDNSMKNVDKQPTYSDNSIKNYVTDTPISNDAYCTDSGAVSNEDSHNQDKTNSDLSALPPIPSITTDRYGFVTSNENKNSFHAKLEMSQEVNEQRKAKETQRERKWIKMLSNWSSYTNINTNNSTTSSKSISTSATTTTQPHSHHHHHHFTNTRRMNKLTKRIRKGIPDSVRSRVWCYYLNCEEMKSKYGLPPPTQAQCNTLNPLVLEDIDKDIDRTFPYHIMFRDANSNGQNDLRVLLQCYAYIDPETNYCQGMSFVAAFLLSYLEPVDAFYCFTCLMNDHPKYPIKVLYSPDMYEIQCILYVFGQLGLKYIPTLYKHLVNEHMDPSMYATEWFMTLYTRGFSFDLVTRIFDIFVHEGEKVLYRVAIALLLSVESELMASSFEDIMGILRNIPSKVDAESVLKVAFSLPITTQYIDKYKNQYVLIHQQKLADRQANRDRHNSKN